MIRRKAPVARLNAGPCRAPRAGQAAGVPPVSTVRKLVEETHLEAEARRREAEIQHAKWERERREKEAYNGSQEQLLAILDRWALARRIEDSFQDLERRTSGLEEAERVRRSDF
jgi:hypothetical protein